MRTPQNQLLGPKVILKQNRKYQGHLLPFFFMQHIYVCIYEHISYHKQKANHLRITKF